MYATCVVKAIVILNIVIAVLKTVGTAATLQIFWAIVTVKLQTIVSHSFLYRFLRFFKSMCTTDHF